MNNLFDPQQFSLHLRPPDAFKLLELWLNMDKIDKTFVRLLKMIPFPHELYIALQAIKLELAK